MVFTRPENSLSRANEFIAVGKHLLALETLYEVVKSRRHRTWTKIHQPIMEKYLELCVLLRKSDRAKDGLYQYRNICQTINVNSLEEVIMGYLRLAEQKTDEARKVSHGISAEVEDLDTIQTPESLVTAAESGASLKGQLDRDVSAAWLKFLWESYKQCLDILKNNNRVELQYKMVAQGAFRFSLKYQRKIEFRKFCDMIRQHMQLAYKHPTNLNFGIKLDNSESIQYLMDTRLSMFETAVKLDLWQEAFKAVEEIHELMQQSKLQFTPAQHVSYYYKASQVFWHAGYYDYHAYALLRHFVVYRDQKRNVTAEELSRFASRLVLAVLSVPTYHVQTKVDQSIESDSMLSDRQKDLYRLLDLSKAPTRSSLLQDIAILHVTRHLPEDGHIKNLIKWLEVDFDPLAIKQRIADFVQYLHKQTVDAELAQYEKRIVDVAVMRLLQQASQVYRNFTMDRLLRLCPGEEETIADHRSALGRHVAQMCRANVIEVRIDDRAACLTFATDLCAIPPERRDLGPCIQSYPQDLVRSQLMRVSTIAFSVVHSIHEDALKEARRQIRKNLAAAFRESDVKSVERTRSERIEKLKSIQEKVASRKKESEMLAARRLEQMRMEEERQRREAELKRREEERKNELKRLQSRQNISYVLQSEFGRKALADKTPEELMNIDIKKLQQKKEMEEQKAERERIEKLISQGRKVDYFVRACHMEELSLLKNYEETYREKLRAHRAEVEKEIIQTACEERESELANRERLARMKDHKLEFYDKLMNERREKYNKELEEFNSKLAAERKRLTEARRLKRKEDRRRAWQHERAEKARKEAEKLRREAEEKQRIMQEKRQKLQEEKFNRYNAEVYSTAAQAAAHTITTAPGSWKQSIATASANAASSSSRWGQRPMAPAFGSSSGRQFPTARPERRQSGFNRPFNDRVGASGAGGSGSSEFDFTKMDNWRKKN